MGGGFGDPQDQELSRMVANAREQRGQTTKQAPSSTIAEDDLRWLLDKEDNGGSITAGAAKQAQEELAGVADSVTKQRIAYGTLRNQTLRRQSKLEALEEEMRLLQREGAQTTGEKREATENQARRDATQARVLQMEQLADEQCEYTLTLNMLIKRQMGEKGGVQDRMAKIREKLTVVDQKTDRQAAEKGVIRHAQWQARNAMQLQEQLNGASKRTRQLLVHQRKGMLSKGRGDVASLSDELLEQHEDLRKAEVQAVAEADADSATRAMQKIEVQGRLRRLEEQFRRIQELMGFADMNAVVEKLIEQQGASVRMEQVKSETIVRHEVLLEEKARFDLAYEEQLGGVDSELAKRRHSYDNFVRAEEESQEDVQKRKVRMDELSLTLTKAHIGLSELEQRLSMVPRIMLRGNIKLGGGGTTTRDRDVLSTIADDEDKNDRGSVADTRSVVGGGAAALGEDGTDEAANTVGAVTGGDSALTKEVVAQSTSAQLEAMHEAEVQMMRTLTHCESELTFLLHEIEKAATPGSRQVAAPMSASPSEDGASSLRQSNLSTRELMTETHGGGAAHAGLSAATTFDYSSTGHASAVGAGAFGTHNLRVPSADEDSFTMTEDAVIKGTFADLSAWQLERVRLRSEALRLPPARGAASGDASAHRGQAPVSNRSEHPTDGASSARPLGERRASNDAGRPGSAAGASTVGARQAGHSARTSREGSKNPSQTSVPSGASLRARPTSSAVNVQQPRAPGNPPPIGGPSPRAASAKTPRRKSAV